MQSITRSHRSGLSVVWGMSLAVLGLVGCGGPIEEQHSHEHEVVAEGEPLGQMSSEVTCNPVVQRFPVAGRHNTGYDGNWATWGCTTANSNTDYSRASNHLGIDIFGARGTPIVAAQSGTIRYSFSDPSGGRVVYIVDSCGWWHYYAHLDTVDPDLFIGKFVQVGTRLGTLGNTGVAVGTAPHLHYSIYPGTYSQGVDPWPYLTPVENASCSSGNACSCLDGINVRGFSIPVTDTGCSFRVCGTGSELYECRSNNIWNKIGGVGSCSGSCTCTGGRHKNGREIPPHMTHCGYRVCGTTSTMFECTPSGWVNLNTGC